MNTGDFVFFSQQGQQEVHVGVITSINDDGQKFRVHEHRQAPRLEKRFTPLYLNSNNNRHEVNCKVKPDPNVHTPTMIAVSNADVLGCGSIHDYMINGSLFGTLRSMGVLGE